MSKKLIAIIFVLMAGITNSNAQFWGNVGSVAGYGSNSYSLDSSFSSLISQHYLQAGFDFDEYFQIYSTMNYINFASYSERNFASPEIGLNFNKPIFNDDFQLILNPSVESRIGNAEYAIFDYLQPKLSMGMRFQSSETSALVLSSSARYKNFSQLTDYNFLENLNTLQFNTSFETKTTLSLGISLNDKTYFNPAEYQLAEPVILIWKGTKGKNNSSGMGNGNNNNTGTDSTTTETPTMMMSSSNAVTSTQFKYNINLAQNLFESTGIALSFSQSFNLSGYKGNSSSPTYDFANDDDIFDDPFSYNASNYGTKLTQILPWEVRLQAGFSYSENKYSYLADGSVNENRYDQSTKYDISLEKTIEIEGFILNSFDFFMNYSYINNTSNESYYSYQINQFVAGFNIAF